MVRVLVSSACLLPLLVTVVAVWIASYLGASIWLLLSLALVLFALVSISNRFLVRALLHWYVYRSALIAARRFKA